MPIEIQEQFPNQFVVEWKFPSGLPDGLPISTENEEMDSFEAIICGALESDGASLLAVVATGNGSREWYFYCRDVSLLQARLNAQLEGRWYPIELHAGKDKDWYVYWTFVEPFVRKGAN